MLIAGNDPQTHKPPEGWRFLMHDPLYVRELDAELWMLGECA